MPALRDVAADEERGVTKRRTPHRPTVSAGAPLVGGRPPGRAPVPIRQLAGHAGPPGPAGRPGVGSTRPGPFRCPGRARTTAECARPLPRAPWPCRRDRALPRRSASVLATRAGARVLTPASRPLLARIVAQVVTDEVSFPPGSVQLVIRHQTARAIAAVGPGPHRTAPGTHRPGPHHAGSGPDSTGPGPDRNAPAWTAPGNAPTRTAPDRKGPERPGTRRPGPIRTRPHSTGDPTGPERTDERTDPHRTRPNRTPRGTAPDLGRTWTAPHHTGPRRSGAVTDRS